MFSVSPTLRWQRTLSTYVSHDMVTCRVILSRFRHLVQALVDVQQLRALGAGEVSLDDRPHVVEPVPVEAVTVDGADGAQELAFRYLRVFEVEVVRPVDLVFEVASFPVAGEPVIAVGVGSQELHGLAAGAGWQAVVGVDAVVERSLPGFWSRGSLIRGMVGCVP